MTTRPPLGTALPADVLDAPASSAANEDDLLALMLEQMQDPMLRLDLAGQVNFANSAALALLGSDMDALLERPWQDWLTPPWQADFNERLAAGPRALVQGPTEMLVKHWGEHLLPANVSVSYMPAGTPCLVVGIQDLSAQKAEIKALQQLAATDCLTGLANRRTFAAALDEQWAQCTSKRRPISLLVIDVDYFKLFNDQYGHMQGDKCLKRVAQQIAAALPGGHCLAARYGGEEFAVLLPGCNGEMARSVAEVIRRHINDLEFQGEGLPFEVRVSVSQGIATEASGQFRTAEALLFAADTALYRAKTDGRDRIKVSC
ncbi:diguanylate cyclase [Gallaecimonas kandeliae]|uniref:sensor domain-containing diguanylate cyclase n=1 Tax=Gallaecimonas kandeliae TaxID=3029055 RepID=UPI0026482904|nr:diguanylate cyclase [Gallaecimonas kandeliae]WKE66250.1 diguanylate cyclase [Gallaecimonas kandeliae]